jgi:hypothetical protein
MSMRARVFSARCCMCLAHELLCIVLLVSAAGAEVPPDDACVVSRRLPSFGLRVGRRPAGAGSAGSAGAAPASASRSPGGVCHMGRLPRVDNTLPEVPGLALSAQMCTRNATALTCAMLAQNLSHPAASRQRMHHFPATTPGRGTLGARQRHPRRAPFASCQRQSVDSVLTRLLRARPRGGVPAQLSFGVPQRLSAARLLAADLRRKLCGANETCAPLERALCPGGDCLRRGAFLRALLETPAPNASRLPPTDALWERSWVWCPHVRGAPRDEFGKCAGSIAKAVWLDATARAPACAARIHQHSSSSAVVNFCLLNAKTKQLCLDMDEWRRDTQHILCQASGKCARTDFFYSPTAFNLREQEFVFDSVLRFYRRDVGRDCPAASNPQQAANEESLQRCASVSIEPYLVIVENLRDSKRLVLLIGYHGVRVAFHVFELLVSATMDTVAAAFAETSTTFEDVTSKLLREVRALMQVISGFVQQMRDALIELALSKGVGGQIKQILVALCEIVKFIYKLWLMTVCPVINYFLDLVLMVIEVIRSLVSWVPGLGVVESFLGSLNAMVDGIQDGLGRCEANDGLFDCNLDAKQGEEDPARGALPLPNRCWSSYLTFFGDNQQLSCSAADTCKASRVASASERVVCSACPVQGNENVLPFACDALSGMCTCGVPQLGTTACFSNEDCLLPGSEATCRLIDDGLQTSLASVPCDECQYERMCFHAAQTEMGVCACGARQRHFHVCSVEEFQQARPLSLRLNNLCLYTATAGVVEYLLASVIACQELDASSSSCAYVVDRNVFLARGFRRVGRRLLGADTPTATTAVTYRSVDSVCRDALQLEGLVHTRARCQEAFERSNETLVLLGLAQQLPPCALCSVADVLDAAHRNPVAFAHVLSNPRLLRSVLGRHGPLRHAAELLAALRRQLADIAQAARRSGNSTQLVFVERRGGALLVSVDDTALPPHVARALEHWLHEMLRGRGDAGSTAGGNAGATAGGNAGATAGGNAGATAGGNAGATAGGNLSARAPGRRLLFFRELVLAVERRVREGFEEADRLHEAFSQSLSQILTYDYAPAPAAAPGAWPPRPAARESCDELGELLRVAIDVSAGVLDGWLTLTHKRNALQSRPADSLRDAWPQLLRPEGDDAIPDTVFAITSQSGGDDVLAQWTAEAAGATLRALDVQPRVFYDVLFSLASAANASFTCPYHAVQTCSAWRVRLWQAVVIVVLYFSAAALLTGALGLSFVNGLLVPFFSLVTLQLCYGYTWTCLPMVPVCAWQDFTESIHTLLPLSLEIPDELKKLDAHCLVAGPALQRYPPAECLKSCRDAPFAYSSWRHVLAWWVADLGAADLVRANAHRVPLLDHAAFNQEIASRASTLRRTSPDSVRAHRVCAVLSSHLLIPYVILLLLLLAFLGNLASALAAQFFPLFLLLCTLFTAVSVSGGEDAASEDEETEQE